MVFGREHERERSVQRHRAKQLYIRTPLPLEPTRAGDFIIPPITATVDGQTLVEPADHIESRRERSASRRRLITRTKWRFYGSCCRRRISTSMNRSLWNFAFTLRSDVRRYRQPAACAGRKRPDVQQARRRASNIRVAWEMRALPYVPFSVAITPVKTGTVSINADQRKHCAQ